MNSTMNGGGYFDDQNFDQDSSMVAAKSKGPRVMNVVPVVVAQIYNCSEDEFVIHGMKGNILSLVAMIVDYEVQSTKAVYNVKDCTGSIQAIWWLEDNDTNTTTSKLPSVKENSYVKIYGSMRSHENTKTVMVLKMEAIHQPILVTNHLLRALHTSLQTQKLQSQPTGPSAYIRKNNPGAELANSLAFYDDTPQTDAYPHDPIREKVKEILKSSSSFQGIHKQQILAQFSQHQHRKVIDVLDTLLSEGHAYTTIDTDHFTSTDGV